MALLKHELKVRTPNKEWHWQDPIEDLFDSLINPESFHQRTDNEAQRRSCDDFGFLFDQHKASSNGSDTIDTTPLFNFEFEPDNAWTQACGFVQQNAAASPPLLRACPASEHSNNNLASHGRTVASEDDLLSLESALRRHLKSLGQSAFPSSPVTRRPTPFSVAPKRMVTPPVLKIGSTSPNPSGEPQQKLSESLPPSVMTASKSEDGLQPKHYRSAASNIRYLKTGISIESDIHAVTSPTSPKTAKFKKEGLTEYPFAQDGLPEIGLGASIAIASYPYADEIEPLSPFSSSFPTFPHPNTPVASPSFNDSLDSIQSRHDRLPNFEKFPSTPVQTGFSLLTPPTTGQMPGSSWGGAGFSDHLIASSASPAFETGLGGVGGVCKAEPWTWSPPVAGQSTAGATPTQQMLSGLGISGMGNNVATGAAAGLMMPLQHQRQHQADIASFSVPMLSAAPPTPSSIAPSLMLNRPLHSPMTLSPDAGMFSSPPPISASIAAQGLPMDYLQQIPSQQQQQHPPTSYRRHHQRHHTIGTSGTSSIHMAQLHRTARTPSPSPPPPSTPRQHKRTKPSHHTRRKSSGNSAGSGTGSRDAPRPASVGFVNFTPDDSRKILTGVAPSGSSKTKARREKEAAERRRKLSEAAKKAVLEAGGDLEALEREGLLVLAEGL